MNNLYEIDVDSSVEIDSLKNSNESKLRLSEMGLMPGVEVRMVKKTPFGGPVQVKLNNYYLTLRKEDALFIIVKSKEIK